MSTQITTLRSSPSSFTLARPRSDGSPRARRTLLALAIVASAMLVSACNTVKGAGQDLEETGDNIQDAARDAHP